MTKAPGPPMTLLAIVIVEAARRIGVVRIPRHRIVAEDDETVDGDALGDGFVAQFGDVAAGIVGAVAGNVDGAPDALNGAWAN